MEQVIVTAEQSVLTDCNNALEPVLITEQEVAVVTSESSVVVVSGLMGPPGAATISDMQDLDKTELTDGATLVYKADTAVWRATNKLDNQILEAGQF